jgi:flagellar L-ring protein precursor FlgH
MNTITRFCQAHGNTLSKRASLIAGVFLTGCLSGCNVIPPKAMTHSPQFEPVYPIQQVQAPAPTGAIYVGRQSDSWFGRGRTFQVGDIITVLLNESTQAARSQVGSVSRNSTNDMLSPGLAVLGNKLGGVMKGTDFSKTDISNKGTGTADQTASLNGSVAVAVVEVMANGNLVLRGEKQLALTEGSEVIQVSGIIRQDDVAPNNTVQSRRLANAQIAYRGTGDLANASRAGWGTSALLKLWPF